MRKIREVLRLHHDAGMGIRAISRSVKASPSTVREYLIRAKAQGLSWPLPESLDDAGLLRRLYPMPAQSTSRFLPPDWSKVHRELRRKGVTLALLWEPEPQPPSGPCTVSGSGMRHRHTRPPLIGGHLRGVRSRSHTFPQSGSRRRNSPSVGVDAGERAKAMRKIGESQACPRRR